MSANDSSVASFFFFFFFASYSKLGKGEIRALIGFGWFIFLASRVAHAPVSM
jgi:hypothetical protein